MSDILGCVAMFFSQFIGVRLTEEIKKTKRPKPGNPWTKTKPHTKENAGSRTGPFLAPPSGPGSGPSQQHQQVLLAACCPRLIRMIHAAEKTRTCTVVMHSFKKSGPFSFRGSCVTHLASASFHTKHSPDPFYLLHVTVQRLPSPNSTKSIANRPNLVSVLVSFDFALFFPYANQAKWPRWVITNYSTGELENRLTWASRLFSRLFLVLFYSSNSCDSFFF